MEDTTRCEVGAEVRCADGSCGKLTRVVVDPVARSGTHLVVEPHHRLGLARLVPLDLLTREGPVLGLRCTRTEFDHLDAAELMPVSPEAEFGYGEVGTLDGFGAVDGFGGNAAPPIFLDVVPEGEVEVSKGDRVHATDGHVGHVRGLLLDAEDRRITHLLLQIGHPWGHHDLSLPIAEVEDLSDGIRLRLSKREVRKLASAASAASGS